MNKPKYYYLEHIMSQNSNLVRQQVNLRELQNDISKGVRNLSEDAYCKRSGGYTQVSLAFCAALVALLGVDGMKGKHFHIREEKNDYVLNIETFSGFRLNFYGVSCGYYGEGSRGASDILTLCQFNKEQIERIFKEKDVKGLKRK